MFLFVAEPFLLACTTTGFHLPLTFIIPRLLRVAVVSLVTEPAAIATFCLAEEPTIVSLVVPRTALAAAIFEMTRKGRLQSVGLVDRFLLLKFSRMSQSSHVFLLEYSDQFLGCGMYLQVTVVTLLDTNIWPREVIPGSRQGRDYCDLELDFRDPEVDIVDQVKVLPIFLEGHKVFADVVPLFGSSMSEVSDNSNGGLLAFVLIDCFEVVPGCMGRRTVLDVDKRFISDILSNKMVSIVIILFPVIMSN